MYKGKHNTSLGAASARVHDVFVMYSTLFMQRLKWHDLVFIKFNIAIPPAAIPPAAITAFRGFIFCIIKIRAM